MFATNRLKKAEIHNLYIRTEELRSAIETLSAFTHAETKELQERLTTANRLIRELYHEIQALKGSQHGPPNANRNP